MTADTPTEETEAAISACGRELPAEFSGGSLAFGFDGVIDNVRTMIDTRHGPTEYDRLSHLSDLKKRLSDSLEAESSLTVEWEQEGTRTGGHACHLSRAFTKLGADTLMVGTYGRPIQEIFKTEFSESTLLSVGEPGYCDAVEFDDGKLMLSETSEAAYLDWETLTDRLDIEQLAEHLDGRDILGVGYWNVTSALPELVYNLIEETWPLQDSPPEQVFFDPGDIRNLPDEEIRNGASYLEKINEIVPVTVSANPSETAAIAAVDGADPDSELRSNAQAAFDVLNVDRFIGHSPVVSVGVTQSSNVAVQVPTTESPTMTTSAGDHFNFGVLIAQLAGLSLPATIVTGNAAAGVFVRTGSPPSYEAVCDFVNSYRDMF
ncbi:hypothetical protein [Haloarcula amylovorans]|uniref:hypothetical protein n=1 Tax=Haloarcula amylovorans TaxID=2562280 RepID=UPI001076A21B|nr:hypothetical protein [Halomicroarcula amylolytica]